MCIVPFLRNENIHLTFQPRMKKQNRKLAFCFFGFRVVFFLKKQLELSTFNEILLNSASLSLFCLSASLSSWHYSPNFQFTFPFNLIVSESKGRKKGGDEKKKLKKIELFD